MYWGIGNPSPWNPRARKGDNLFTTSVFAIRPETGERVWYYQATPQDAFDFDAVSTPIIATINVGGSPRKVVIQAKRYKNTVGVSAVRDLFGTLQNEGASKGILVTTSGYGQASFDFAQNKPIELIDGANLLYLLSEHAGIEAKIMPPDDWKDPAADAP